MTKRTAKASKRNGKSIRTKTRTRVPKKNGVSKSVSSDTNQVNLSASEKKEIAPLAQQLREAKISLADAQISILRLESRRLELAEVIVKIDQALMEKAKETAVSHGIDLNDTSNRWNLDTEVGVFTRAE